MGKHICFLPFLVLAACAGDEQQNAADLANVAANETNAIVAAPDSDVAINAQLASPSPATLTVGALRIPYDAALLAPVRARIPIPPDWRAEADALKLIARDRAALIGKAECMYGQAGQASRCNALQEAGLAFAALDRPYAELAASLPAEGRRGISLAGVEGTSWLIGAEGEGAEHILLPAPGGGTMLIVRQFRSTGNPSDEALGTVLYDLVLRGG